MHKNQSWSWGKESKGRREEANIRHMNETGKFAESLSLGYITPLNILINLFINDGMKGKVYRKNLLHSKYSHIGTKL